MFSWLDKIVHVCMLIAKNCFSYRKKYETLSIYVYPSDTKKFCILFSVKMFVQHSCKLFNFMMKIANDSVSTAIKISPKKFRRWNKSCLKLISRLWHQTFPPQYNIYRKCQKSFNLFITLIIKSIFQWMYWQSSVRTSYKLQENNFSFHMQSSPQSR